MRSRHIRRRTAISLAIGLLLFLGPFLPVTARPSASAATSLSSFRVTNLTPEQQGDTQSLRQALAERGISQENIGVFALTTPDGPTTVVTRFPDEFLLTNVGADIYEITRVERAAAGADHSPGELRVAANGSDSEWFRNNADCDIYSTKGFARTQCFDLYEQAGDTDPTRTFWQYTAEASGHSKGGRKMDRMWVERTPAEDSAPQEFDGVPEPKEARNRADNCRQESEGVSISSGQPVQVGWSHTWNWMTCETYRPKMYDDEGHWATIWEGSPDVGEKDMRHVMFTMPVRTTQGGLPAWIRLNGQHTR